MAGVDELNCNGHLICCRGKNNNQNNPKKKYCVLGLIQLEGYSAWIIYFFISVEENMLNCHCYAVQNVLKQFVADAQKCFFFIFALKPRLRKNLCKLKTKFHLMMPY